MTDDGASGASGSESTTIEINIKTLESQVHKLRVQKSETVLNLKEKIVDVAGIPMDQHRLIFRGRVLKDDHLLSEYQIGQQETIYTVGHATNTAAHCAGSLSKRCHSILVPRDDMVWKNHGQICCAAERGRRCWARMDLEVLAGALLGGCWARVDLEVWMASVKCS